MKTIILSSAAVLGLVTPWPLLFTADAANQTQPFLAAPSVATYGLEQ